MNLYNSSELRFTSKRSLNMKLTALHPEVPKERLRRDPIPRPAGDWPALSFLYILIDERGHQEGYVFHDRFGVVNGKIPL